MFDLAAIETSLREVSHHLASINPELADPREALDDAVIRHMVAGYGLVETLIDRKIDLFSFGCLRLFLELNAVVLCGCDEQVRLEAAPHLAATDRYFFDNIDGGIRDVVEWHALHAGEPIWRRAAGVYIRILSEPELFIEGNHRTGALVMSYLLARDGHPPFVLTIDNARAYLDWSTLFTTRRKGSVLFRMEMPWLKSRFADFLQVQSDRRFVRAA